MGWKGGTGMGRTIVESNGLVRRVPTLAERIEQHLEEETGDKFYCKNAWALRRVFRSKASGEQHRFRCGLWKCPYCGPRKVLTWRALIEQAQPTHHLILTKAGKTLEEAARALTTFMQALRRGSKGRGRGHIGARLAYPVEYTAIAEEHKNFEKNGFHWHLLLVSRDEDGNIVDIPKNEVIRPLWMSATHYDEQTGKGAKIAKIVRVRDGAKGAGYVTKYLLKDILRERKGAKEVRREIRGIAYGEDGRPRLDKEGHIIEERVSVLDEVESHARRIRYSRHFFPESTKEMRRRLFAPESVEGGEESREEQGPSEWEVVEIAPPLKTVQAYKVLERAVLTEVLTEREEQGKRLSSRVVRLWNYQKGEQEAAHSDGWVPLSPEICARWAWKQVTWEHEGIEVEGVVTAVEPDGRVFIQLPDDEETSEQGKLVVLSLRHDEVPREVVYQLIGWWPGSVKEGG